jgi:hypothetical protein
MRILTGPDRTNPRDHREIDFLGMEEFCRWLNMAPRIPADDHRLDLPWFSTDTINPDPAPGAPIDVSLDRLSQDTFCFATRRADLLSAYSDYERITWAVPDCGWTVTLVRLSRPVSWYGARLVAREICDPLNIGPQKSGFVELEFVELLRAGVVAEYHPGVPYFALPNDTMRALYLRQAAPAMARVCPPEALA